MDIVEADDVWHAFATAVRAQFIQGDLERRNRYKLRRLHQHTTAAQLDSYSMVWQTCLAISWVQPTRRCWVSR
jgi:hypothetical protein